MKIAAPQGKIKILKGNITQRTKNSIVVFDAEKSLLQTFNATASFIFDRLRSGSDVKTIAREMTKEFEITQKKAEKDIDLFIQILISKGFVKRVGYKTKVKKDIKTVK